MPLLLAYAQAIPQHFPSAEEEELGLSGLGAGSPGPRPESYTTPDPRFLPEHIKAVPVPRDRLPEHIRRFLEQGVPEKT